MPLLERECVHHDGLVLGSASRGEETVPQGAPFGLDEFVSSNCQKLWHAEGSDSNALVHTTHLGQK